MSFSDLSPVIGSEREENAPFSLFKMMLGITLAQLLLLQQSQQRIQKANIPTHIEIKKDQLGSNGTLLSYLNNCVRLIRLEFLRKLRK